MLALKNSLPKVIPANLINSQLNKSKPPYNKPLNLPSLKVRSYCFCYPMTPRYGVSTTSFLLSRRQNSQQTVFKEHPSLISCPLMTLRSSLLILSPSDRIMLSLISNKTPSHKIINLSITLTRW